MSKRSAIQRTPNRLRISRFEILAQLSTRARSCPSNNCFCIRSEELELIFSITRCQSMLHQACITYILAYISHSDSACTKKCHCNLINDELLFFCHLIAMPTGHCMKVTFWLKPENFWFRSLVDHPPSLSEYICVWGIILSEFLPVITTRRQDTIAIQNALDATPYQFHCIIRC